MEGERLSDLIPRHLGYSGKTILQKRMLLFVKRNTPIDKKEQTFVAKRIFLLEGPQPLLSGEGMLYISRVYPMK